MRIFLALMLILWAFAGCDDKKKDFSELNVTRTQSLQQGDKLNFTLDLSPEKRILVRADGDNLAFETNDKATMFVFFTTWCEPCNAMVPHFNVLQGKFSDKLSIIGVLLEEISAEELAAFKAANRIDYDIANGDGNYLLAKTQGGITAVPEMILYDGKGRVYRHYKGIVPEEMLEIDILQASE